MESLHNAVRMFARKPGRSTKSRFGRSSLIAPLACALVLPATVATASPAVEAAAPAKAAKPNIFFYNLDDLRDAFPGAIDPLQYMPKTRQWMAAGTRFANSFVPTPACTPSRSAMLTGRFAHNNGVRLQTQGGNLDAAHTLTCYLDGAGYATYEDGKFLTTWPKTKRPPCFHHSTVIYGGYRNVASRVDGVTRQTTGYSTTVLGVRGREYIGDALSGTAPFFLYETPHAPHWSETTVNGQPARLAIPDTKYASAPVGSCAGVPEADRSDKPPFVRNTNVTTAQGKQMCESQMRAIMTADDEFAATMQLLSNRGVLANTLVILSSDNGYNWGEHGRTEKFVAYEPALRVPLWLRWPGHFSAGVNTTRLTTYLDIMPTILEATSVSLPAGAPRLDGESLLQPSARTSVYAEYDLDSANGFVPTWRAVRKGNVKYIQTYNANGAVTFREWYNLANDPAENTNLLGDASSANDPPAAQVTAMTTLLNQLSTCSAAGCVR
ncbi:MAG TPA: sulfatase-like hydrolase/transferase [Nocardioidaceae bacterium]|nr:sulfatase-like hydrolase/transferase [Nocardioidaceae bacterium]